MLERLLRWIVEKRGGRYYGGTGTIHNFGNVDVELYQGRVVAVWYRCALLPFSQTETNQDRAIEMLGAYFKAPPHAIVGIEFLK